MKLAWKKTQSAHLFTPCSLQNTLNLPAFLSWRSFSPKHTYVVSRKYVKLVQALHLSLLVLLSHLCREMHMCSTDGAGCTGQYPIQHFGIHWRYFQYWYRYRSNSTGWLLAFNPSVCSTPIFHWEVFWPQTEMHLIQLHTAGRCAESPLETTYSTAFAFWAILVAGLCWSVCWLITPKYW